MCLYERHIFEEEELRSSKLEVQVSKVSNLGDQPPFLGICHRHFEKAKPFVASGAKEVILMAPLDMLDFLLTPALVAEIDEIQIVYKRA